MLFRSYGISYGSYSESAEGIQAIKTYSEIVKSLKVAERAALILGDDSLDKFTIYDMIEVEEAKTDANGYRIEDNAMINIHAYSTNEEDAIRVVNAVADAYVMEVASITLTETIRVLDQAYTTTLKYNAIKNQLLYIGIFAAIGLILSCGIIICQEIFSTKVLSIQQGTLYNELDLIGIIPIRQED